MFGSGDFFPGPGRIMAEYRSLGTKGEATEQHKEWIDHSDGKNCSLVITTTKQNERGGVETNKITYADITMKAFWEKHKQNFANGLWIVFERDLPGKLRYSYIKWTKGQVSPLYREAGVSLFLSDRLPYLEPILS